MPLQRDVPDPTAVNPIAAAYIQIDRIEIDLRGRFHHIILGAYRSKAAADAGKQAVYTFDYTVAGGRSPDPGTPGDVGMPTFATFNAANAAVLTALRTAYYNLVKTQPELLGAVDVA